MLFALFYGVFVESSTKYFLLLSIYLIPFTICYFLITLLAKNKLSLIPINGSFSKYLNPPIKNIFINVLSALLIVTIIIHYIDIGFIPAIKAYFSSNYYEVVDIRKQGNYLSSKSVRYFSSFMIKSIIPFLLFYLLISKRYILFIVIYTLGILYAFSLMQKSFIFTILFPCITYVIFKRHYLKFFIFIATLFLYVFCLLSLTNPQLKPTKESIAKSNSTIKLKKFNDNEKINDQKKRDSSILKFENEFKENELKYAKKDNNHEKTPNLLLTFTNSLIKRVFITPGKIVSKWFENIPSNQPFLGGCGYRFIAPIIGCEYQNYNLELYKNIFPKYAARGIKGNVNTTSFMYEYSNFGVAGLIFSALVMGLIIAFIDYLFAFSLLCKFSINSFYVLMLSSSALTTLMFSGGWALMIILFYIYRSDFLKLQ